MILRDMPPARRDVDVRPRARPFFWLAESSGQRYDWNYGQGAASRRIAATHVLTRPPLARTAAAELGRNGRRPGAWGVGSVALEVGWRQGLSRVLNRIAAMGRRLGADLRGTTAQISWAYLLMMVSAGLTIGAIAGLSNTSVTNTLLELILPFAAGSAGIYILNRETLRKEAKALPVIGVVGVSFFLAFWAAFLPASWYRYHAAGHHEWDAALSAEENFARAEVFAHAHALGMSRRTVADALAAQAAKSGGTGSCPFLAENPPSLSATITQIYGPLSGVGRLGREATGAAAYLHNRFEPLAPALKDDDADKRTRAMAEFDAALKMLLALSRDHADIARPSTALCLSQDRDPAVCAGIRSFEQHLNACADSAAAVVLLAARAHARAFEAIWERSAPPAPPRWTMEKAQ